MKLVHVVPHIDKEAAGPSYSVPRLCQHLAALDHEVILSCLAAREPVPKVQLELHKQWRLFTRFAISPQLHLSLARHSNMASVVHNHSLWSMPNVAAGWATAGKRVKLVTSPRGTLSPQALARSRWVKRVVWPLQKRALFAAHLLHATSEEEYRDIRALGLRAPVALIPNGIDLPDLPSHSLPSSSRTLLYMGRIHPIKGIDRLLRAWAQVQSIHFDWQLVIAGIGEDSYVSELKALAHDIGLQRVSFSGPAYGSEKTLAYLNADATVLPTHSENFGMVVAEALALGRPALVAKGAPWQVLETERCGWWVNNDVDSLVRALSVTLNKPRQELLAMGQRGRKLMEKDYSWPSVAERMDAAYRWIVHGGPVPECVRTE